MIAKNNLTSPGAPTARDVERNVEATRRETNVRPSTMNQDHGDTPLFGDRGDRPIEQTSTVPHTVDSNLRAGDSSGIAAQQRQAANQSDTTIGIHQHTHGITDVSRAEREGSA